MPRLARIDRPRVVHHVISRFVDRSWLLNDDEERAAYLHFLNRALARSDWTLLAYALMSNHVHLVFVAGEAPLASWAKSAHAGTAAWMNRRHRRLGPVFAERPRCVAVSDDHVRRVIAYVHNNPVRAGLALEASRSHWTSHRSYLGEHPALDRLNVSEGLARCGYGAEPTARAEFDEWTRAAASWLEQDIDEGRTLARVRAVAGSSAQLASPLVTPQGTQYPILLPASSPRRLLLHVAAERVIQRVASALRIDPRGTSSRDHLRAVADARRVALRIWRATGRPRIEMARALGIGSSAASDLASSRLRDVSGEMVAALIDELVCEQSAEFPETVP